MPYPYSVTIMYSLILLITNFQFSWYRNCHGFYFSLLLVKPEPCHLWKRRLAMVKISTMLLLCRGWKDNNSPASKKAIRWYFCIFPSSLYPTSRSYRKWDTTTFELFYIPPFPHFFYHCVWWRVLGNSVSLAFSSGLRLEVILLCHKVNHTKHELANPCIVNL